MQRVAKFASKQVFQEASVAKRTFAASALDFADPLHIESLLTEDEKIIRVSVASVT